MTPIQSKLFGASQTEATSDDYLTPRWIFDTMGIGFDLDVAGSPAGGHVPATRILYLEDDGLSCDWSGRVWMNPPYSNPEPWARRFMNHGEGVALLPCAKSQWFREIWAEADAIGITPGEFDFDGHPHARGGIWYQVCFAAYGAECVDAISNLGPVRVRR